MLARAAWFATSLILLGLGSLTVFEAPTIPGWWLALFATEFGHWAALAAFVAAAATVVRFLRGARPPVLAITAGLFVVAGGLLLRPVWLAATMSGRVSNGLDAAFGTDSGAEGLFRFAGLVEGGPPEVEVETHEYARVDGRPLLLDLRRPTAFAEERPPVVLLVHGGGWESGSRAELPRVADRLAAFGWAVVSIDYRLAPGSVWPAPLEDVRAARAWLAGQADGLGLDPERVVLFGRSAGAQIALAAAYDATLPPVRGVIAFYGPADLLFAYEHGAEDDVLGSLGLLRNYLGGAPEARPEAFREASPILQVRSDVPPSLLVHGRLDSLVWHRQSERLAARLDEAGARHHFLSLPWATHAFEFNLQGPGGQLAMGAVERFLGDVGRE